jgi:hypothetical protein
MGSRSKAPTLFLYGLLNHDVLQYVCDPPSSAELLAEISVMKVRTSGYNFPFGPKVEKSLTPVGYLELDYAVDALGKDMFPTDWGGEERGYFKTGYAGQKFRSKIEYETDSAFRDAVLYAQCELECDLRGGDPQRLYAQRKAPVDDDRSYIMEGDPPTLSTDKIKEIEEQFATQITEAKKTRGRREKVEDVFLRQLLWAGLITANYVAVDGKIVPIEEHIWGSDEGRRIFERGWLEIDKGGGLMSVRAVLITERDMEDQVSSAPAAKHRTNAAIDKVETSSAPRFSQAEVRAWYQSYVERVLDEGGKSSRDDDLAAAREYFGIAIQRKFMRDLRRLLAPEGWKSKGAPSRKI